VLQQQYEDEGITEVIFGDIDVTSGWQGGVADNTSKSTDIKVGSQYSITVKMDSLCIVAIKLLLLLTGTTIAI